MRNIFVMIITLTVGVILAGALLAPVIDDVTSTERTFVNDGYFKLTKYGPDDTVTFSWDAATPDVFTVNDSEVTYHNDTSLTVSVVLGEKFAARLPVNNTAIQFYGAGTYVNTNATYTTFTLTYSSGTLTATNGNVTKEIASVTEIYVISETGDYTMKKSDAVAYLNSGSEIVADSEIYASGQTYNGNNNIFWHLEGSIDNMEYPDSFNSNLTITDEAIHGEYNSNYEDLYMLNNLTFTATTNTSVVYDITASYFVVPAEVTAEKSHHLDDGEIAMMDMIPIMVIICLVMAMVGYLVFRSRD